MVPSSLKKMSGSRARKEGNYASSDLPSSGTSRNIDLGLTLLLGSQTQKEGEGKLDHVVNTRCESLTSKSPEVAQDAISSKVAKQQEHVRSGSQYGSFYPPSAKRGKLDRRMSTQWLEHSCSKHLTGAVAIKARGECANVAGQLGQEQRQEDNALSVRLSQSLKNREAWEASAQEPSSGSTSVSESKTLTAKIPDALTRSVNPNVNEVRLHDKGSIIDTTIASKQIADAELWEAPLFRIQDRSRIETNSHGFLPSLWDSPIKSNTNIQNRAPKLRKVAKRSWTSHFPRASKGTNTRRHARVAVTSPLSIAFISPQHARPVSEYSTNFRLPEKWRTRQKILQPVTKFDSSVGALSLEGSLNIAPPQSQRYSSRKRTCSLPTLPSARHASSMDLPNKYQSSGLPTPPHDQRVNGSYHRASSQLLDRALTSHNVATMANPVSNIPNPIATNKVSPIRSRVAEGDQYPMQQSSHSSPYSTALSIRNFHCEPMAPILDRPYSTGQSFLNNEATPSTFQQSQHQVQHRIQLNIARVEASLGQSQGRWPTSIQKATEDASSQWKIECDQLKINYDALQQETGSLWQQVRFLEVNNSGLHQRLHAAESNLASRDQLVAKLQDKLTRIQSELEAKAARPRPDAAVAKSLLRRMPPEVAKVTSTRINALGYHHAAPDTTTVSVVAPSEASHSQPSVTDTTTGFQTKVRPVDFYGQTMTPAAIPSIGQIKSTMATSTNDFPTSSFSTHLTESKTSLSPMGSIAHTHTTSMPDNDESSLMSNTPEKVTINLTDESSSPSLSDIRPKLTSPASGLPAESDHEELQGSRNRSKDRRYGWLTWSHWVGDVCKQVGSPSMGSSTVEPNLSEQLPVLQTLAVQPKQIIKKRAKKAQQELGAGAKLDEAHKERLETEQANQRRENKAASNKKYGERQKQLGKQSGQSSDTSTSRIRQPQKETRKSAKVQRRQEQAQRSHAEIQRQVAQYTLDDKASKKPASHPESSTEQTVEQSTRFDGASLFGDDNNMDWSQDFNIEDPTPEINLGEGLNEDEYGAMLEATMAAQAEMESMANLGQPDAGAAEGDASSVTVNTIAETGLEGSDCFNILEGQESEESEEE